MRVCVCVHVYVCVCVRAHRVIHIYIYMYSYICMHMYICTCIYVHICTYTMYPYVSFSLYTSTVSHISVCVCVCVFESVHQALAILWSARRMRTMAPTYALLLCVGCSVLLSGAGCCRVLQGVEVCCSVLQCVAEYRVVSQCLAECTENTGNGTDVSIAVVVCCSVVQCVAVCCSMWQCVAVCCSVLQCVAVCCSVLRCGAVCCSVLQCVAIYLNYPEHAHAHTHKHTHTHVRISGVLRSRRQLQVGRYFVFGLLRLNSPRRTCCVCKDISIYNFLLKRVWVCMPGMCFDVCLVSECQRVNKTHTATCTAAHEHTLHRALQQCQHETEVALPSLGTPLVHLPLVQPIAFGVSFLQSQNTHCNTHCNTPAHTATHTATRTATVPSRHIPWYSLLVLLHLEYHLFKQAVIII